MVYVKVLIYNITIGDVIMEDKFVQSLEKLKKDMKVWTGC